MRAVRWLEQVTHYYPFGGVYGDEELNASAKKLKIISYLIPPNGSL